MTTKGGTSKDIIRSLQAIRRAGKSDKAALFFLDAFCDKKSEESIQWANRCLAIAEITSRLAPKTQTDVWYTAGLLHDLPNVINSQADIVSRQIAAANLRKAGYTKDAVFCIYRYKQLKDPRDWTPLMTAIIYADSHVSPAGDILTSEECCGKTRHAKGDTLDLCTDCMYARYVLSKWGSEDSSEAVLKELRYELEEKECRRQM